MQCLNDGGIPMVMEADCCNNVYNASSIRNVTTMQCLSDGGIATMSCFNNGGWTWYP
jgi:hypothetical protein